MTSAAAERIVIDTQTPFGAYRAGVFSRFAWRLADRHSLSRSLRKRVRKAVARFFPGPFDADVDGLHFRIYPSENYDDRKILARGRLPEQKEHALLAPYFSQGAVFVDVGANIGAYALFAAARGASVLAIEASPFTASKLAYNVSQNIMAEGGSVKIAQTAVGAETGTLDLWAVPSNCGFATLVPALTKGEWAGDWRSQKVTVRPLNEVILECKLPRIDVLKIDVEGFEDRVLMPFLRANARANWPRVIMLETNCRDHWEEDCLAEFARSGYRVVAETDDNVVVVLDETPEL